MFTVGASRIRQPLRLASPPSRAPTSSMSAGFQVAASAVPQGTQVETADPSPGNDGPRAPFGPSVIHTFGIPSRSMATVDHRSAPAVRDAFSSRVRAATRCSTGCAPVSGGSEPARSDGTGTHPRSSGPQWG